MTMASTTTRGTSRSGARARGIALALLFSLAGLVSGAAAGTHPHDRQGWTLGLGLGGGSAVFEPDGGASLDREGGFGGAFRVGYAFNPKFAAGILSSGWSKEQNGATTTFSVGGVGVTFYPDAAGFHFSAGIGGGNGEVSTRIGNVTTSISESGLGFLAAAGYEWRLTRRFALGPQIDFGYASLDSGSFDYVNGVLQANWYFIPR
jgi:hypothetical protein